MMINKNTNSEDIHNWLKYGTKQIIDTYMIYVDILAEEKWSSN